MRMERDYHLIILHDLMQWRPHVLANGGHDRLLCLGIKLLQCGSCSRVDIDFPGEELLGVWKARRD